MRRPLLAVCLCLVFLAALRLWGSGSEKIPEGFASTSQLDEKEPLTVTGWVYRKENETVYLKNVSIANLQKEIPLKENIICEWKEAELPLLGSLIKVTGVYRRFSEASNPGEFDQRAYYRTLKIGGKLTNTKLLGAGRGYSRLTEALYRLKLYWKDRLYRILPEKEASVMSTMLLGEKAELDSSVKELYKRNGIVHILSISGLHITIIGMGIYRLLRRGGLPAWLCALAGGAILIFYGLLTGLGVSACRAIGMYLIRMLGEIWGRTYDMLTALGVAGAVTVLENPLYLTHAGFLLSYGAVLGMGVLNPVLLPEEKPVPVLRYEDGRGKLLARKLMQKLRMGLTEAFCAGISITAATLPVLLWFYYEVPVYSLLLNLPVLALMKPVMTAGMLAMLVPGMEWLGMVDRVILAGYELLCRLCAGLPFHTWNPGKPRGWQVVCYYVILFGWLFWNAAGKKRNAGKKVWNAGKCRLSKILLLTALVTTMSFQVFPREKVTFLDVGQGDCICISTLAGENYLFDCGSTSRSQVGNYVLVPFLKQEGISRLDGVFVSHSDADHCNGVKELLEMGEDCGIAIERLILPETAASAQYEAGEAGQGFLQLLEAAAQSGRKSPLQVEYIKTGDSFRSGKVRFTCLHPPKGFNAGDANACSECFLVEFSGMSLLLTGDVEGTGEELLQKELERRGVRDITILKTAHHGSRNSTREELLQLLKPQMAVISCGQDNRYGHPHEELLQRLEKAGTVIMQTPQEGAITVTFEKRSALVRSFRQR